MAAEDVSYRLAVGELNHTPRAGDVCRPIGDIQPSRIQVIPREKDAGAPVVVGEVRRIVPRNCEHIDDSVAEVDTPLLLSDCECLLFRFYGGGHQCDVRHGCESLVSSRVIAVCVGVRNDETGHAARHQGRNDGYRIACACTGVYQKGSVFTEYQIQERLFVVRAAGFAQYVKRVVVGVNLPAGDLDAVRASGPPRQWECSGFDLAGEQRNSEEETKKEAHDVEKGTANRPPQCLELVS